MECRQNYVDFLESMQTSVMQAVSPSEIRSLLRSQIEARAEIIPDPMGCFDPHNPFLSVSMFNSEPENWVALALARLVQMEQHIYHHPVTLLFVPNAARWMCEPILNSGIFGHASIMPISKEPSELGVSDVSQVGTLPLYWTHPKQLAGKHVILFDDILAQGKTIAQLVQAVSCAAAVRIDAVVGISKRLLTGATVPLSQVPLCTLTEGLIVKSARGFGKQFTCE